MSILYALNSELSFIMPEIVNNPTNYAHIHSYNNRPTTNTYSTKTYLNRTMSNSRVSRDFADVALSIT